MPVIHIEPGGIDLEVGPNESVAESAWRQGYTWPTRCWGQADCMVCWVRILDGELASRERRYDEAIVSLTAAVTMQDAQRYNEPPTWHYPVRQSLGAVLLAAGQAAKAETVYREDLRRNPENGWSLFGLAKSLEAQQKTGEAEDAWARFRRAWGRADVTLTASRF